MNFFSIQETSNIFLSVLVGLALTACATNNAYRTNDNGTCDVMKDSVERCSASAIQIHNQGQKTEYKLGFVEINDQGQFRDNREQLNVLIKELENTPKDEPLIISVFVHGWHHNAKEGDANIESFKDSLAKLTSVYEPFFEIKRKVFGVYVGWRGDSVTVDYLNELTFWDRKNTAGNVGHVGLSELLLKLEKVKNERNEAESKGKDRNRLAIIGHSFGGAAVYQEIGRASCRERV